MTKAVRERPLPFSPPMMAAVRRAVNPKTQTRRLIKPEAWMATGPDGEPNGLRWSKFPCWEGTPEELASLCPKGVPGDRLWTRERFGAFKGCGDECKIAEATYVVLDDGTQIRRDGSRTPGRDSYSDGAFWFKWRPPMFMPRWASRLTLDITDVRVQRVEDISEEDAIAEGFSEDHCQAMYDDGTPSRDIETIPARLVFLNTFYDLNHRAPRGVNPWVWAITFTRAHASPSAVVAPNSCAP